MYQSKEKKEQEEEGKRGVGIKNPSSQRNRKYGRNAKAPAPLYNNRYINKFQKRNNDLRTKRGNHGMMSFGNLSLYSNHQHMKAENIKANPLYANKTLISRSIKENTRTTLYKKNYFAQDNINYNTFINSQTPVCSFHIEKTEEDIKNQNKFNETVYRSNDKNVFSEVTNSEFPSFVEEVNFTNHLVQLSAILVLSNNDKIFNNLEFEGRTIPSPNDCNLCIYVNVINKYTSQYYKQLYPVSYNFKNRLLFATPSSSSVVDSSLLVDKIIIKGNFKTLSLIVLGQPEEITDALISYRENLLDANLRSRIGEDTLDVENVDLEKDHLYVPRRSVDIKTYNITTLIDEKLISKQSSQGNYFDKIDCSLGGTQHEEGEPSKLGRIGEMGQPGEPHHPQQLVQLRHLSDLLEEQFLKNNADQIGNSNCEDTAKEEENDVDHNNPLEEKQINGENVKEPPTKRSNEHTSDVIDMSAAESETTYTKKDSMPCFIPPDNELIIKILNEFTELYKMRKHISKDNSIIYRKIIKYGMMWLFYIFHQIKKDQENFLFNYAKYTEIKTYDILGCLLLLRRCALYSELARDLIHMNFNSHMIYMDPQCPHVLINLVDMLSVNNVYFFSSWKIKTSILKSLIALISDAYVMNHFCTYVDEDGETPYQKLLKVSSSTKMKRYNAKRLLGIILCRVKLYQHISSFERTVMHIVVKRRSYDKKLFSQTITSKLMCELKNVHKELFQHSCRPEKFEIYLKGSLFLNSYDIAFVTAVNDFLFYFLNCSGGINLLLNYNFPIFEKLYKSICLLINKKMKDLNGKVNDLMTGQEDGPGTDQMIDSSRSKGSDTTELSNVGAKIQLFKTKSNEAASNLYDSPSEVKGGCTEKATEKNDPSCHEFQDPYDECGQVIGTKPLPEGDDTTDTGDVVPRGNIDSARPAVGAARGNLAPANSSYERDDPNASAENLKHHFIFSEKNFFYDNSKCIYTYNDVLRNRDLSDDQYMDGFNYKDMKNVRNYCSYILCALKTFFKTNLLIELFFNSGGNISLEHLKFFNVLSSYPLSKLALFNNDNFYYFFLHLIHLLYYFIYLEKLYEEGLPSEGPAANKSNCTNLGQKDERREGPEKDTERKPKQAQSSPIDTLTDMDKTHQLNNSHVSSNTNECILVTIRYLLGIIYNLIFYDESGHYVYHLGYSIYVCLEEIKNITGEVKKNKDYSFGNLNNTFPNRILLKNYLSNDKLFYNNYFYLYDNLKGLYSELYRYEKKKFNEMSPGRKKELYEGRLLNVLSNATGEEAANRGHNTQQSANEKQAPSTQVTGPSAPAPSLVNQIKQRIQKKEKMYLDLPPLKSTFTPSVTKIIEICKVEKDSKYALKKSKELNNYNCKLNNDIYINNSSKNCSRLGSGSSTNHQYVELLEELDDTPSESYPPNRKVDTTTYPFLPLNLLYYYMNLCPNVNFFSKLYDENGLREKGAVEEEEDDKYKMQEEGDIFYLNRQGVLHGDDVHHTNYIFVKNDKIDETNKPIRGETTKERKTHNHSIDNYIGNNKSNLLSGGSQQEEGPFLANANYISKHEHGDFKNIGTILYVENNLQFIIKLITKCIFYLNGNTFKLSLLNFNKMSGRILYKILKNRRKTLFLVKSILNILLNFFYNLTSNANSISLKSYRNSELFYSLLFLLNKLLSFSDWLGSNNTSECNHHSSVFLLRYNIIYLLRIFSLWFNKTTDNQSFLFRCVLKYTRILPSFSTSGMLLILTFFDLKNIFPDYIYSFFLAKNLKGICYDAEKANSSLEELFKQQQCLMQQRGDPQGEDMQMEDSDWEEVTEVEESEEECEEDEVDKAKQEYEVDVVGEADTAAAAEEEEHPTRGSKQRKSKRTANRVIGRKGKKNKNDGHETEVPSQLDGEPNLKGDASKGDASIGDSPKGNPPNGDSPNEEVQDHEANEEGAHSESLQGSKIPQTGGNKHELAKNQDEFPSHAKYCTSPYDKWAVCRKNRKTFDRYALELDRPCDTFLSDVEEDRKKEEQDGVATHDGEPEYYNADPLHEDSLSRVRPVGGTNYRGKFNTEGNETSNEEAHEKLNEELYIENMGEPDAEDNQGRSLERVVMYCKLDDAFQENEDKRLYLCCDINVMKRILNEQLCDQFRVLNLAHSTDDHEEMIEANGKNNKQMFGYHNRSLIGNLSLNLSDVEDETSKENKNQGGSSSPSNFNILNDDSLAKNYIGNNSKGISFLSTRKFLCRKGKRQPLNPYSGKGVNLGGGGGISFLSPEFKDQFSEEDDQCLQSSFAFHNFKYTTGGITSEEGHNSDDHGASNDDDFYHPSFDRTDEKSSKQPLWGEDYYSSKLRLEAKQRLKVIRKKTAGVLSPNKTTSIRVMCPYAIKNFVNDSEENCAEHILKQIRQNEHLEEQHINLNRLSQVEREKIYLIKRELKIREYTNLEDLCDYINFIVRISKTNNVIGRALSTYCCVLLHNHRIPIFSILFNHIYSIMNQLKKINMYNTNSNDDETSICMNKINFYSFYSYNSTQLSNILYTYNKEIYLLKELSNFFSLLCEIFHMCFFNSYKNNYNRLIRLIYLPSKKLLDILYDLISNLNDVFPQELIRYVVKLSATIFRGYAYVLFVFFNKQAILHSQRNPLVVASPCERPNGCPQLQSQECLFIQKIRNPAEQFTLCQDKQKDNEITSTNTGFFPNQKVLLSCPNYVKYIKFFVQYYAELINTKNMIDDENKKKVLYKYAHYVDLKTVHLCLINIYEIVKNRVFFFFSFFKVQRGLANLFFRYVHRCKSTKEGSPLLFSRDYWATTQMGDAKTAQLLLTPTPCEETEMAFIHLFDFYLKPNRHINLSYLLDFFSCLCNVIQDMNYKIIELYQYINVIDMIISIIFQIVHYNFNSLFILHHLVSPDASEVTRHVNKMLRIHRTERLRQTGEAYHSAQSNSTNTEFKDKNSIKINTFEKKKKKTMLLPNVDDFKRNFLSGLLNSLEYLHRYMNKKLHDQVEQVNPYNDPSGDNFQRGNRDDCNDEPTKTTDTDAMKLDGKAERDESATESTCMNRNKPKGAIGTSDAEPPLHLLSVSVLNLIRKVKSVKERVLTLNECFVPTITFKTFLLFVCYEMSELKNIYRAQTAKRSFSGGQVPGGEANQKRRRCTRSDDGVDAEVNNHADVDNDADVGNDADVDNDANVDNDAELGEDIRSGEEDEQSGAAKDSKTSEERSAKSHPAKNNDLAASDPAATHTKDCASLCYSIFNDANVTINSQFLFKKLSDVFYAQNVLNKVTKSFESHQHIDDNYLITVKNMNASICIPSLNKKLYDHCSHLFADIQSRIYLNENDQDRNSFTLFNLSQESKSKEIDEQHALYNYITLLKEEKNKLQKKKMDAKNVQAAQTKGGKLYKRSEKNTFEDHFRNRKTVSSRAPSKHVDDYEAANATNATSATNATTNASPNEGNGNLSGKENEKENQNENVQAVRENNDISLEGTIKGDIITGPKGGSKNAATKNMHTQDKNKVSKTANRVYKTSNMNNTTSIGFDGIVNDVIGNDIDGVPSSGNMVKNDIYSTKPGERTNKRNNEKASGRRRADGYASGGARGEYQQEVNYDSNYDENHDLNGNPNYDASYDTQYDPTFEPNQDHRLDYDQYDPRDHLSSHGYDMDGEENNPYDPLNNYSNEDNLVMNASNRPSHHPNDLYDRDHALYSYKNKNDLNKDGMENNLKANDYHVTLQHDEKFDVAYGGQFSNHTESKSSGVAKVSSDMASKITLEQDTQNGEASKVPNKNSQFEDCTCYKFNLVGWKEFSEDGHKNDLDVCKIVNKPVLLRDPRIKMKFLKILDRHKNIKDIFKKLGVDIK
ncbi:hypothetical protein C922_04803 [Plasmodium inui San Antonio 1]|uniref:Uncharacterized protein n=1 Tax=Plasmodium inui San Antonio 1 TaxID=1237626 RepID=W6ZVE2_9APIC|nr:hypothetical protein C922_04803 [Plasmodium inui San Antonio 1]EUD64767.1 hypothetical protein C922_04803 [Plasmodium inui San Antonio 1]